MRSEVLAWFHTWLPIIRDLFQVGFFISVAIVTILTYSKAKRTLLQPLRTEVFKEQIKALTEILGFFTGKGEIELREDFGLPELFKVNVVRLYDDYARHFFDADIDPEQRPYSTKKCPHVQVKIGTPENPLRIADNYLQLSSEKSKKPESDPRTRAATWAKYDNLVVSLPDTFVERMDALKRLMDSPLIPKELIRLVDVFISEIDDTTQMLRVLLNEAAQEMPEKYPNAEAYKNSSPAWLDNRYIGKLPKLEKSAKNVTEYVRNYFTSDRLLD